METIVFGKYTLGQALYGVGGIVAVIIFITFILKLFKSEEPDIHVQIVKCKSCGWQGQVSRYAGKCPKCSESLGDRLAKKKKDD